MHGRTCVVRVEVNQWALAVRWRRASERGDKRRCMNEWNKPGPFGNFDGLGTEWGGRDRRELGLRHEEIMWIHVSGKNTVYRAATSSIWLNKKNTDRKRIADFGK